MATQQDHDSEISPLLGHGRASPKAPKNKQWILFLVCVVIVTIEFGSYLSIAPQTQILESIICRRFYPGNSNIDNVLCKRVEVQSELALINGWKDTLDALPGILLALPYGLMADRLGRKKVTFMCLCGLLMEETTTRLICWYSDRIPPRAIWFTPLFQICGGGSQIAGAMVYTIVSDIFPAEKRANIFFVVSAAVLTAEILATPLSAWMMTWSIWLPYILGIFCEVMGLLAVLGLPETLPKLVRGEEDEVEGRHDDADEAAPPNWKGRLKHARTQIARLTGFIWSSPDNLAISLAFLTASVGRQSLQLMLQYVSKRFGWTMSEASFLISLKGIINLVGLLVLLPLISQYLRRYFTPVQRDLAITQGSVAMLVCGFGIMAWAMTPVAFAVGVSLSALGWGFYSALRSVASALVDESQNGILNTTIGLVQGVGMVVAGPLLATAFRYGMVWDGGWFGLPYLLGTGLFVLAGLAVCTIRIVD